MNCKDCRNEAKCGQKIFYGGLGILCPSFGHKEAEPLKDTEDAYYQELGHKAVYLCTVPGCINPAEVVGPCAECRDRFGDDTAAI